MNVHNRHIIILAAAVLLASCHGSKEVALPQPSPRQEVAPTEPRELTVTNFTATLEGITVNGQLRIASDSVMGLTVSKIVEIGRAMATPDSVWINAPLLDKRFAGDYNDLSRRANQTVNYQILQDIATDENAEQLISSLAHSMGINARVKLAQRRKVDRLTFPFVKP